LGAARAREEATRLQCEAEKAALGKQFEQRVAGLRLEKEQVPSPYPNEAREGTGT
jgi:hypothetical protein